MSVSKPSICFWKRIISVKWRNKLLVPTLIWQVIEGVRVVYSSWFSWRYDSLLRFGIGGPRSFPRLATTMISKRFVKLGKRVYFWILQKIWRKWFVCYLSLLFTHLVKEPWRTGAWNHKKLANRLWTSLLVRAAVFYQTLLGQTQTKPYWPKFSENLR